MLAASYDFLATMARVAGLNTGIQSTMAIGILTFVIAFAFPVAFAAMRSARAVFEAILGMFVVPLMCAVGAALMFHHFDLVREWGVFAVRYGLRIASGKTLE